MSEDWDIIVGHWIENIPYFWKNDNNWKKCIREYIIPENHISYYFEKGYKSFPGMKECEDSVRNYFRFLPEYSKNISFDEYEKKYNCELRMNGVEIYLSKKILLYKIDDPHIYELYNVINIPLTKIDNNWKKLITSKKDEEVSDQIIFPGENIRISPEKEQTRLSHRANYEGLLMFWYIENIKKYKNICIPVPEDISYISHIGDLGKLLHIEISVKNEENENFTDIIYGKGLSSMIKQCMDHDSIKRIIIPIKWNKKGSGHANVIIIDKDKKRNKLYIFDPHGMSYIKNIAKHIKKILKDLDLDVYNFEIITECCVCNLRSFQSLEEGGVREGDYEGFCLPWTIWTIDLFLKNPNLSYPEAIKKGIKLLSKKDPEFRRFIRRYTKFIEDFGEKKMKELGLEMELLPSISKVSDYSKMIISGMVRSEKDKQILKNYLKNLRDVLK